MFIRKRYVKGPNGARYTYYSIVETYRIDGKPRQKTLYNMGKRATIARAIAHERKRLDLYRFCLAANPDSHSKAIERTEALIEWLKSVERDLE